MKRVLMMLMAMGSAPAWAGDFQIQTHWEVHGSRCDDDCGKGRRDSSSRGRRAGKTVSLLWGTDGFTAGLYATRNLVIEGTYAMLDFAEERDGQREGPEWFRYGLHLKNFYGNSFYSRWGIEHDQINMAAYGDRYVGTQAVTNGVFGIGNQWQWDYFTLGVRWFQVAMPLMTKVRTVSSTEAKKTIAPLAEEAVRPRLEYLALQMGVSF